MYSSKEHDHITRPLLLLLSDVRPTFDMIWRIRWELRDEGRPCLVRRETGSTCYCSFHESPSNAAPFSLARPAVQTRSQSRRRRLVFIYLGVSITVPMFDVTRLDGVDDCFGHQPPSPVHYPITTQLPAQITQERFCKSLFARMFNLLAILSFM